MSIGVDLDRRRQDLKDEYSAALRFQMQKLGPHFPTAQEIQLAKAASEELQNEDTDRSPRLIKRRELLDELAYDFEEVNLDGQPQVVWKGSDSFLPDIDGTELYLTQEGQLIERFYISEVDANRYVHHGWNYRTLPDTSNEILGSDVAHSFMLSDTRAVDITVSRWDDARKLVS